jgi:hypothetical protein
VFWDISKCLETHRGLFPWHKMYLWHLAKMIENQGSGLGYPCDFIVELGYLYFLPQMYLRVEKFVK